MLRISQPRIISFVQFLGKRGIFRPPLEYCTQNEWVRANGAGGDKRRLKIALDLAYATLLPNLIPGPIRSAKAQASFSVLPENLTIKYLFCDRIRVGSSVDAMSRTDCSFVEFCEGFSQIAGLVRRQIPIANGRDDQTSDHTVGVDYSLLNCCWVRSVGDAQFGRDELVRQREQAVPLGGTI